MNCIHAQRTGSFAATLAVAGLAALLAASPALAQENWPEFRGSTQHGVAESASLPVEFGEDQNVTWKTEIPHRGFSTPVVWGDQVWLTTATEDGEYMYVYCVDRDSGEVLFEEMLFYNEDPESLGPAASANSYASPTAAIEEGRVYVHFGTYGTAAIDTDSFEVVWERRDLETRHYRGPGSSVIIYEDKLILTMDGIDVQYLAALDTETGETVWQTPRSTEWDDYDADGNIIADGDLRKGYGTPLVYEVNGQTQMLSVGAMAAFAYDPDTGEELWTVTFNGYNAASRPVKAGGYVLINTSNPSAQLIAIDPDGEGDITQTNIAWEYGRGVPIKPSPVVVDDVVFFVNDQGVATAVEGATGEELWKQRLGGGGYSSSPIAADGHIYFFSEEGQATVIKASEEFERVVTHHFDEGIYASPAVAGDAMFVRTMSHLFRIEE